MCQYSNVMTKGSYKGGKNGNAKQSLDIPQIQSLIGDVMSTSQVKKRFSARPILLSFVDRVQRVLGCAEKSVADSNCVLKGRVLRPLS